MRRFSKLLFLFLAVCVSAVYILPATLSSFSHLGSRLLSLRDVIHTTSTATGWTKSKHVRLLADVNGDGLTDLVGFGDTGVFVSLSRPDGTFSPLLPASPNFAYNAGGWRVDKHVRLMGDVNGDGRADIVGFGQDGVYTALGQPDGTFTTARRVVNNLAYGAGGWRVDQHPRLLGDVNGDGLVDIVGFGTAGVYTALGRSDGSFSDVIKATTGTFGYGSNAGNWRLSKHVRLLGDVNGDGRVDIIAFGDAGVYVALGQPDGTFSSIGGGKPIVRNLGYNAGGWRIGKHPRLVGDINGDGHTDIVGFGGAGVYICLGKADGTFTSPVLRLRDFGFNAGGWRSSKHVRELADVNGDGRMDIVAFGGSWTFVSLGRADGTLSAIIKGVQNFAYNAGGWRVDLHQREVRDTDGDGRADVVGFGGKATFVARGLSNGAFAGVTKVLDEFGVQGTGGDGLPVVKEQMAARRAEDEDEEQGGWGLGRKADVDGADVDVDWAKWGQWVDSQGGRK